GRCCYHALMRLIRRLTQLQQEHGHQTDEALRELARAENVPLHRLQELVSFYPHFRTAPRPAVEIAVCRDMVCWLNGTPQAQRRREELASSPNVAGREVSCLGRCDLAPACLIAEHPGTLGDVNNKAIGRHEGPLSWRADPYAAPADHYGVFRELLGGD